MSQQLKLLSQSLFLAITDVQSVDCWLNVLLLLRFFFVKKSTLSFVLLGTIPTMLLQLLLELLVDPEFLDFKLTFLIFLLQLELLPLSF